MADGGREITVQPSPVGYGRPPVEHRFKKGATGNPRGRPPKTAQSSAKNFIHTQLEDILLVEALRPIQVRENDKIIELPMIQAVVRSMGVAAVKGSHRSQAAIASMVQAVQAKQFDALQQLFVSAVKYKDHWQSVFEESDRRGQPRPEPLPHPDEMALDLRTMQVKFNGPQCVDEKAEWDQLLDRRRRALEEVEYYRGRLKRRTKYQHFYEEELTREQGLADMIGGVIPDQATRRRPGFDIQQWRDEQGVVETLKRERTRRPKRTPRLKV